MKAEYRFKLVAFNGVATFNKTVLDKSINIDHANDMFNTIAKAIQASGFDQDDFQPPLPDDGDAITVSLVGFAVRHDGEESELAQMRCRVGFTNPAPMPKVRVLVNEDGYTSITTSAEMDVQFLDQNVPPACDEDLYAARKKAADEFYEEYNELPHQYRA